MRSRRSAPGRISIHSFPINGAARRAGPTKGNSFAEGTPILTQEGLIPIEEVPVGALVASWNPQTETVAFEKVTGKSSRVAPGILRLTIKNDKGTIETVSVTPNHPYLIAANDNELPPVTASNMHGGILDRVKMDPSGYWEAAGFFKTGQKIKSATGGMIEVVSSELDPTPTRVYNFEVANNQSYAVGELGAWAHNGVLGPSGKPKRHFIMCGCRKEAFDRALDAGSGTPIEHSNPKKGCPHFHPADKNGVKIPGPHFEYPK